MKMFCNKQNVLQFSICLTIIERSLGLTIGSVPGLLQYTLFGLLDYDGLESGIVYQRSTTCWISVLKYKTRKTKPLGINTKGNKKNYVNTKGNKGRRRRWKSKKEEEEVEEEFVKTI